MIDYGYLKPNNVSTLQSVMKHKKNSLLDNLGKADITSHVNFQLLNEFFLKNTKFIEKTPKKTTKQWDGNLLRIYHTNVYRY